MSLKQERPELHFGEVSKALGEEWSKMEEKARAKYEMLSKEDSIRYQKEAKLAGKGKVKKKSSKSQMSRKFNKKAILKTTRSVELEGPPISKIPKQATSKSKLTLNKSPRSNTAQELLAPKKAKLKRQGTL